MTFTKSRIPTTTNLANMYAPLLFIYALLSYPVVWQSWTFRHPDFHANRKDALENIKRKVPSSRKTHSSVTSASTTTRPLSPPHYSSSSHHLHTPYPSSNFHVESLQNEIRRLREEGDDMRSRLRTLERNYESVLLELVSFQRGMAQQDGIMQNLIGYFMGSESGEYCSPSILTPHGSASNAGARSAGRLLTAAASMPAGGDAASGGGPVNGFSVSGLHGGFNAFSAVGIVGRTVF